MAPATGEDLERDIFGDGSELSSEEDDIPRQRQRQQQRVVINEDAYGSSDESSDGYVQERAAKPKRRTKTRRPDDEDGARTQRKRKRKPQITEEELNDLPPEKASKLRMEMQLDAILKPKKASRRKNRKKDADEEILDRFADEEVSRLREAMLSAAADDEQANREKLPATNKLKLLPQVMEVLRKQSLSQSIMDNNLLEGVRRWLEPLPDRSLPALNIQRDFFPILKKMEFIDSAVLKESGLGRIVLFYSKCKRVTSDVQRIANDLISTWSRPIIKRSASYRDRVIPTALEDRADAHRGGERLNAILARAKEGEKNRIKHNAVMIPQRDLGSYTVAPKMNGGVMKTNESVENDVERRRKNAERLRTLTRKVTMRT
ncbi:transcription factor iws1 [Hygrophoropsis aurantiaca]|uniref:Transcription factor iws1 n=1 Tax=Hygrophoropsis aurantiaca TaxID=72124 RepID=A0ACB8A4M8_9AGAM|nr:transcription factor iws1 [Hygrophoropsis aurantiaca]